MIKVQKNYNVDDAIDFIFDGNQSDLQENDPQNGVWRV